MAKDTGGKKGAWVFFDKDEKFFVSGTKKDGTLQIHIAYDDKKGLMEQMSEVMKTLPDIIEEKLK